MKLGVQLNSFDWNGGAERFGATLADIARLAEESGFDRIAVADHVWQHPIMGGPEANEPECYAMLSFIAAHTERVGLGDLGDARRSYLTALNEAEWSRLKSCLALTRGVFRKVRSATRDLDHIRSGGLDG